MPRQKQVIFESKILWHRQHCKLPFQGPAFKLDQVKLKFISDGWHTFFGQNWLKIFFLLIFFFLSVFWKSLSLMTLETKKSILSRINSHSTKSNFTAIGNTESCWPFLMLFETRNTAMLSTLVTPMKLDCSDYKTLKIRRLFRMYRHMSDRTVSVYRFESNIWSKFRAHGSGTIFDQFHTCFDDRDC